MAHRAVHWNRQGAVVGIGGLIIIGGVAARTGIRCGGIIALVTSITIVGNRNMRSCEGIKCVVIEGRWHPCRLRMACGTLCRELSRCVVRTGRSGIIAVVATVTGVGRIRIVTVVTSIAIIRNRNVCACKRINGVVIKRGWCPRGLRVASGTLRWELGRCVVWIGRSRVICIVATIAGVRRIGIVTVVTSVAIIRNRHVCTYEWINRIVVKS